MGAPAGSGLSLSDDRTNPKKTNKKVAALAGGPPSKPRRRSCNPRFVSQPKKFRLTHCRPFELIQCAQQSLH
jgi:hypothetical protein